MTPRVANKKGSTYDASVARTAPPPKDLRAGSPMRGARVPALDGIRGFAIAAVLLFHADLLINTNVPVDSAVNQTLGIGWIGVDVFFVLSGFLITGILIDTLGAKGYFSRFYARRALRIVPAYYVLLIAIFYVFPLYLAYPRDLWDQYFLAQPWFWTHLTNWWLITVQGIAPYGTGHLWSLAVEEQFYLAWPFVVLLTARRSTRPLEWTCVAIVLLSPIARGLMLHAGYPAYTTYVATFTRLDGLAAGAWLACFLRRSDDHLARLRPAALLVAPLAAVVFAGIAISDGMPGVFAPRMLVAGVSCIAFGAGAWIVLTCTDDASSPNHRVLTSRVMQSLGKYSYAMYLFHYPIVFLLRRPSAHLFAVIPRAGMSELPKQAVMLVATIVLTYLAARISWLAIERPALWLKRFVPYAWEQTGARAKPLSAPPRDSRARRRR